LSEHTDCPPYNGHPTSVFLARRVLVEAY